MTAAARRVQLRPSRADLVDAGFVLVLGVVALLGFRTTYDGWHFALVGGAGLLLGVLVGQLAVALRQPAVTVVVMAVAVFFLLGGAIALRADAIAGVIPTVSTWSGLADLSINGWKQLLTTLPPVDGSGPLLTIPYILGLLAGAGGHTLARRSARPWAPVVAMTMLLAAVILLGTVRPADEVVQGALFAAIGLGWLGLRNSRRNPHVGRGTGRGTRLLTAVVLLGVAGGFAVLLGPALPGGDRTRTVLRAHVVPPFDIGQYPSPLTGFQRYTPHGTAKNATLLTVKGLPPGTRLRFATLDGYNGSVWGATNGTGGVTGDPSDTFQRVGSRMDTGDTGRPVTFTITIADGAKSYAAYPDTRAWVPTAGTVTAVRFGGPRAEDLEGGFRFNLDTDSGVTSALLGPGDTVQVSAVLDQPVLSSSDTGAGQPVLGSGETGFTSGAVAKYAGKADTGTARLLAIADALKSEGYYSDGGTEKEKTYLPGHSLYRLLTFLNRPDLAGTDEHYAATFALMANQLGIPARVVVGGLPEPDGTVRGSDVHAWVEVRIGTGVWATVPYDRFTPPTDRHPPDQQETQQQKANPAVVPPPTVTKPQSSLDQAAQLEANSQRLGHRPGVGGQGGLPGWLVAAAEYGGPPVGAVLLIVAAILGAKEVRRRRRRTRSVLVERYSAGWREILDTLRDLGVTAPAGQTRREQAERLGLDDVQTLARAADRGVFGPAEASEIDTADYWRDVDVARRAALQSVGRARRWRAALSIRSFLPQRTVAS